MRDTPAPMPIPVSTTAFAPSLETSRELRRAFGQFGTGVTIVTTMTAQGPLGMTANSFSSISLDPALVLWSPSKTSRRHGAFVEASHFCIHILAADQHDLAMQFATQGHDFAQRDWRKGQGDAPVLSDCLATFQCATHAVHDGGDHSLVLGRVLLAAVSDDKLDGLLFDQGRFGRFVPDA